MVVELSALLSECDFAEVRIYGSLNGLEYNQSAAEAGRPSAATGLNVGSDLDNFYAVEVLVHEGVKPRSAVNQGASV